MNGTLRYGVDRLQVAVLSDWHRSVNVFVRHRWMTFFLFPVLMVPWIVASQLVAPTPVPLPAVAVARAQWDAPAVVIVIGSIFTGLLSLLASWRAGKAEAAARASEQAIVATHEKVVAVAAKTDVIESQGNSQASAYKTQIIGLEEKLQMMVEMLAKSEKRAVDLAERAAPMRPIPEQLARIEANTAAALSHGSGSDVARVVSEALHATPGEGDRRKDP